MAINKVVMGNRTLIDVTGDTVTAATLIAGKTAHAADGTTITGTLDLEELTWNDLETLTNNQSN